MPEQSPFGKQFPGTELTGRKTGRDIEPQAIQDLSGEDARGIDPKGGQDISRDSDYKACMAKCGRLLGSRDYTEYRLREKLSAAGFSEQTIGAAFEKLRKAGYLDDSRYARSFVRCHLEDRSVKRIEQDLLDRGIDRKIIEEALEALGEEQDLREVQRGQIRRLLEKRGYDPGCAGFAARQKQMAFLAGKGYPADLIREAME